MKYEIANRVWHHLRYVVIALVALYLIGASRLAPQFVDPLIALSDSQKMLLRFLEFVLVSVVCASMYPIVDGDRLRRLVSAVAAGGFTLFLAFITLFPLQVSFSEQDPSVYTLVVAAVLVVLTIVTLFFWGPLSAAGKDIDR